MGNKVKNRSYKTERIWELDFLRGLALLAMVYFHIVYDLKEFYHFPVSYQSGLNFYIGRVSALTFILLSGISCKLSRSSTRHGLKVLSLGIIITIVTMVYNPAYTIKFGILHFLGICMIAYPLLAKLDATVQLLLGTLIIWFGRLISQITVTVDFLFPLGFVSQSFISSDYYPVFPWLGVFLYGMAIGKAMFLNKQSILNFRPPNTFLNELGKKTLFVYVAHQPIIILILHVLYRIKLL